MSLCTTHLIENLFSKLVDWITLFTKVLLARIRPLFIMQELYLMSLCPTHLIVNLFNKYVNWFIRFTIVMLDRNRTHLQNLYLISLCTSQLTVKLFSKHVHIDLIPPFTWVFNMIAITWGKLEIIRAYCAYVNRHFVVNNSQWVVHCVVINPICLLTSNGKNAV